MLFCHHMCLASLVPPNSVSPISVGEGWGSGALTVLPTMMVPQGDLEAAQGLGRHCLCHLLGEAQQFSVHFCFGSVFILFFLFKVLLHIV